MTTWNLHAHLATGLILNELAAARTAMRRTALGPPRPDADALAAACDQVDTLQGPVDRAATLASVAALAGDRRTARTLGRATAPATARLERLTGPWLTWLGELDAATFETLTAHPRLAPRAAALAAVRLPAVAPPTTPRHRRRLARQVAGPLAALSDRDHAVRDAATRTLSDRLAARAEATAAAYHRHVTAALRHGGHDDHVASTAGIDPALLATAGTILADRGVARRATTARADALGRPVGPGDRLVPVDDHSWTLPAALDQVRAAAAGLGDPATVALEAMLTDRRVWAGPDAPDPVCVPVPYGLPWIAVPFDGTTRALSHLAHELFHGIHACLTGKDVPLSAWRAQTAVAEAAAGVGEWLVADAQARAGRLVPALDFAATSLWRQQAACTFERACFARVATGGVITADWAAQLWRSLLDDVHGDDYHHGPGTGDGHWWALFDHLWAAPGYLAAYVVGGVAAASVAAALMGTGAGAPAAAWRAVLAAGGTVDATMALSGRLDPAAIDLPAGWC